MCGTYFLSMEAGKVIKTFKGYNNVPCILYSLGIFLFIKDNAQVLRASFIWSSIERLKGYAFAIYLLHWFVMHSLIRFFHIETHSIIYRLGGIFLVSFICICLTWCIRKVPVLGKKVLPQQERKNKKAGNFVLPAFLSNKLNWSFQLMSRNRMF